MAKGTIRNIHSILSGAFEAAERWEWIDRNPADSQLLAAGFDLGNTAARLGQSGGGATTLKHYADPVSEVDCRAAAYLAQLTTRSAAESS